MELTQKILDDVFKIYWEVSGLTEVHSVNILKDIQSEFYHMVKHKLGTTNSFEFRGGSKWTGNSKFEFIGGKFSFYGNYHQGDKQIEKEIEKAEGLFSTRVEKYFSKQDN